MQADSLRIVLLEEPANKCESFSAREEKRALCRTGLGLYDVMHDVVRNGGFVSDQGKETKKDVSSPTPEPSGR